MLRQPEFSVVVFVICLLVFNWPLLSIPGVESPQSTFFYLFFLWAAVILLLLVFGPRATGVAKGDERPL